MSVTRILCEGCGFPQVYCTCKSVTYETLEGEKVTVPALHYLSATIARLRDDLESGLYEKPGCVKPTGMLAKAEEAIVALSQGAAPAITDEMVERAAKAIYYADPSIDHDWEQGKVLHDDFRKMARAALGAAEGAK